MTRRRRECRFKSSSLGDLAALPCGRGAPCGPAGAATAAGAAVGAEALCTHSHTTTPIQTHAPTTHTRAFSSPLSLTHTDCEAFKGFASVFRTGREASLQSGSKIGFHIHSTLDEFQLLSES
eukprot:110152-Pleurochrysis_carterae.AAC.1